MATTESTEVTDVEAANEQDAKTGFYVTDDAMQVLYTGSVPGLVEDFVSSLESELAKLNIKSNRHVQEAAQRVREHVTAGSELNEFVLFEGRAPEPPIHGEIMWAKDFFKKGFVVDPDTGQVDYRQPLAEATVYEDDLLAEVRSPRVGKAGRDVYDNKVPPEAPESAVIRAGYNVRHDQTRFVAKVNGLVRFSEGQLSVDDVYVVEGSVGLTTGNINHPGALVVKENVDNDSVVEASGDIEVGGFIEAADIKSGGDLTVSGGIMGDEGKTIVVQGSVQARFLRNVTVEAGGDVTVVSAIEQCTIQAGGTVRVQQGRIVGGETHAVVGIDAQEIGSEAYVRTVAVVGYSKQVGHQLEVWRGELEELEETLAKIESIIDSVKGKTAALDATQRQHIATLIGQADEGYFRRDYLKKQLKELEGSAKGHNGIVARKKIYPSTSVSLGPVTGQVKEEMPGPTRVAIVDGDIGFVKASGRGG